MTTAGEMEALRKWTTFYPYRHMGLIPALREIQERRLAIGREEVELVAALFELPVSHVLEVVTFFPFFTRTPTGRYRVGLCQGISCALAGTDRAEARLERALGVRRGETRGDGLFSLERVECLGACDHAPAVLVNEILVGEGTDQLASDLASDPEALLRSPPRGSEKTSIAPGPNAILTANLESKFSGRYPALEAALNRSPASLVDEVKKSNLRGLGGAGFPTGMKWSTVPSREQSPGPRYFVVNADESEPGCFKDRVLLERAPHQLLEGLLIASYAIGSERSFVFIRGEYGRPFRVLEKAIAEAESLGLIGENILGRGFDCRIQITRGAGAYISGLDTALLETMEGKKAWPRQPPPFPTVSGLFGKPTVVNNVETVSMLPHVIARGAEWFASVGTEKSGGTSLFALSGHVERPGIYEFPMGTPLRTILEAAGGVRGGRPLKGVIPGGASTPVLRASEIDVPMDFESLRSVGSFKGAGGVVVLDETTDMAAVAHNIERFLAHESCGQCTPCREGSEWTVAILDRVLAGAGSGSDLENLDRMGENITGKVICALGDTVGMVTRAYMKKFPEDFQDKVEAIA